MGEVVSTSVGPLVVIVHHRERAEGKETWDQQDERYGDGLRYHNALVNQIPHYPPPGPMRGFDKEINERPFPQGGAFDMIPFDLCWLKSSL